jgi:hypothetical protein
MYSASSSIRAIALLILSSLCGTVAFPQGVKFIRNAADPLPVVNIPTGRAPCSRDSVAPCDTPAVTVPLANPCNSGRPAQIGCETPKDLVQKDLAAMGKTGQKILRARDRVLEILQTENACSEWLRQSDPNPAATFRTLSYAVDRHGDEVVRASRDAASQYTYRDPYVARVEQDTGAFAIITLNVDGAFFQPQAPMLLVSREGGSARNGGVRLINIGPYPGNSLAAQTLALLHEFGHVINLLPIDFENEHNKSMQNTAEVLRYCGAEIESKRKRGTLQAAR